MNLTHTSWGPGRWGGVRGGVIYVYIYVYRTTSEITESALSARVRSSGLQRIRSFSVGMGGVWGGLAVGPPGLHAPGACNNSASSVTWRPWANHFFDCFFNCFFNVFSSNLGPFWYPFGINFQCIFSLKNALIFWCPFWRLWDGFWVPRPSKIELSCKRDAHFRKITFFVMVPFFVEFWCPKASQNEAKIYQKINQKINAILHWKKDHFLSKKGAQMGSQRGPKTWILEVPWGVFFTTSPRYPKWMQNGSKMEPK